MMRRDAQGQDRMTTCLLCGKARKHRDMRSVTRVDDRSDRKTMCRWCVQSMFTNRKV